MSSNISLESAPIGALLEEFRDQMKELNNLVNKLDAETKNIKKTWEGNASDETLEKIDKFKVIFEDIRRQNQKYVNFVDYVVDKYKEIDEEEKNFVETRKGAFDTSFYGDIQS